MGMGTLMVSFMVRVSVLVMYWVISFSFIWMLSIRSVSRITKVSIFVMVFVSILLLPCGITVLQDFIDRWRISIRRMKISMWEGFSFFRGAAVWGIILFRFIGYVFFIVVYELFFCALAFMGVVVFLPGMGIFFYCLWDIVKEVSFVVEATKGYWEG